jgi:Tfp pilus assembly protein PilO
MKKINININKKNSILYLVIYGGIILIIILVGILPYYLKISNQVKENDKLKYHIKEQKELGPVYQTLIKANENKDVFVLPHPEKTELPRLDTRKFQTDFQNAAKKSGLKVVSFTPDINTSASTSTSFLHNIVLKGELADFRRMLIELGSIPCIDRIEEINIQQNTGSMEFKIKVWIAIK